MADTLWFKDSGENAVLWNGTDTVCYGVWEDACCVCAPFEFCYFSTHSSPDVLATLSGVTNQVCGDCTSLNTTWNLSTLSDLECIWETGELSTGLCGLSISLLINADLLDTGGLVIVNLKILSGIFVVSQWLNTYNETDGNALLQSLCNGDPVDLGTADSDLTTECVFGSATATIELDI